LVWQQSYKITLKIYKISSSFPKEELFGLSSQIRRSAVSIGSNIAEGCGRSSDPDMKRFLIISAGSCSELEYQSLLSKDLGYISVTTFKEVSENIISIRKMLYAFIKRLGACRI
jgi:four helix bundle protein